MKKTFPVLLLLALSTTLAAQSPYALHWRTDLPVASLGLGTAIAGLVIGHQVKPLEPGNIALLHRNDVFKIDRRATYWLSSRAGHASDFFMYASEAVPFLLLAYPSVRKEVGIMAVMYVETMLLNGGITLLTKNIALRTRPFVYNPDASLSSKQGKDTRKSFFSGHTSVSSAGCFFAAKIWSDMHPDSRWKPVVWSVAATIPAVTGYLRMRAGKHFFTDVATGYVVGAAIGWLVPSMHQSGRFQEAGVGFYGSFQGGGVVWRFSAGSKFSPKSPRTFVL